jgi:NAD dependent epimerase/dehydratase family enzyme
MAWVHEMDFVAAVRWLIARDDIEGVVNVASPQPLPNADFMRILRDAAGVRFGLPASRWMLEIGAVLLRTETELILKSRRVVPARLLAHGFRFAYPDWRSAADDLCRRARSGGYRLSAPSRASSSAPLGSLPYSQNITPPRPCSRI